MVSYNIKNLQKIRSDELQKLVIQDQLDRKNINCFLSKNAETIRKRDTIRITRVEKIFKEGHLKSSEDYLAAALIYQHGGTTKHYYQAYRWAKKAVELGNNRGKDLSALAIDRYLISMAKKQLFGSQFYIEHTKPICLCIYDVELGFSDRLRKKYSGYSLEDRLNVITKFSMLKQCSKLCFQNQKLSTTSKFFISIMFPDVYDN